MLANDTNNKASGFTQGIDPKFIRTMKGDLTNPLEITVNTASPTSENPFIKGDSLLDSNIPPNPTPQEPVVPKPLTSLEGIDISNNASENHPLQNPFDKNNSLINETLTQKPDVEESSSTPFETDVAIKTIPALSLEKTDGVQTLDTNIAGNALLFEKKNNPLDTHMGSTTKSPIVTDEKTLVPQQPKIQPPLENTSEKIMVAAILMLIILSLGGGGYYYWATKQISSNQDLAIPAPGNIIEEKNPTQPVKSEDPITINPISEKYSQEKPNLLSIDTKTVTQSEIRGLFIRTGNEIKQINPSKPLAFILVDENNNPIAFSRFIIMAEINLPKTLVGNFDENFSLYFYLDKGHIKTGLQIDSKSKVATTSEMKTAEKSLISMFDILYLENKNPKQDPLFSSSSYESFQIRYFNIDPTTQTSFDYTITEKYLFIGTSKDTLRNIIEKNQF